MNNNIGSNDAVSSQRASSIGGGGSSEASSSSAGLPLLDQKVAACSEFLKGIVGQSPTTSPEQIFFQVSALLAIEPNTFDIAVVKFLTENPHEKVTLKQILTVYENALSLPGYETLSRESEVIRHNLDSSFHAVDWLPLESVHSKASSSSASSSAGSTESLTGRESDVDKPNPVEVEEKERIMETLIDIADKGENSVSKKRTFTGLFKTGYHISPKDGYRYVDMLRLFSKVHVVPEAVLYMINRSSKEDLPKIFNIISRFEATYLVHAKPPSESVLENIQITKLLLKVGVGERFEEELIQYLQDGGEDNIVRRTQQVRELIQSITNLKASAKDAVNNVIGKVSWDKFNLFKTDAVQKVTNYSLTSTHEQAEPHVVDFNNYGIVPLSVVRNANGAITSFEYLDKTGNQQTFQVKPQFPVIENDGVILLGDNRGTHENHDVVSKHLFQNGGGMLMTLCDGCGQSHSAKLAAALVVNLMTGYLRGGFAGGIDEYAQTAHDALKMQFDALQEAQRCLSVQEPNEFGDTTLAQTFVKGDVLTGVFVGDAKGFILRPREGGVWQCIDLTKGDASQRDATDSGGRLVGNAGHNPPPELDRIRAVSVKLEKGDVVMILSDGVSDCFDPQELRDGSLEMESNVAAALHELSGDQADLTQKMEERLKQQIQARTVEEKIQHFSGNFKIQHQPGWGKMDNANMGFYVHH